VGSSDSTAAALDVGDGPFTYRQLLALPTDGLAALARESPCRVPTRTGSRSATASTRTAASS
jgi:hypothetical protein